MTTKAEQLAGIVREYGEWTLDEQQQAAALLRSQAAEIERLKQKMFEDAASFVDVMLVKYPKATVERDKANTLLRQALETMQREVGGEPLPTLMMGSIAAIKTHLGEQG